MHIVFVSLVRSLGVPISLLLWVVMGTLCMCACSCFYMYLFKYMCPCVWGSQRVIIGLPFNYYLFALFSRYGLLMASDSCWLIRLVDQQDPGTFLPLPPPCWHCRHAPPWLAVFWLSQPHPVSCRVGSSPDEPSLQPWL